MLFHKKKKLISYDSDSVKPVLHCSICTGEQVAGFKNMKSGKFTPEVLIQNEKELKQFMDQCQITSIEKEY